MADLLADIPDWKQAYMNDLTTSIDIEQILLAALLKGTLIVVADGSTPGYWQPTKIHFTSSTAADTLAPHHLALHHTAWKPPAASEDFSLSTY
jgi:hypothetical protein